MGQAYDTRASTLHDGNIITAALFNNEYNKILNAFSYASSGATGHQHDGTAGEGGNIHTIGDQDFLNKIVIESDEIKFFIEVGGAAVEQLNLADGVLAPETTNDVDLGTSSKRFKTIYATTLDVSTTITNAQLAGSIANDKLANSTVSYGGVSLALGASDATPAFDLSDATSYPTSSLSGTITNAQLAGSIANAKLSNSSVSFGGVSVALGASDATPAFDLADATNYPTSSLSGTITNAQLAGSIANAKLANSSVSFGGVSVALGASDATPAFDLADATNYPTSSLSGTIATAQIADQNVTGAKIAATTIGSGNMSDSAITTAKIADDAVTSAKLASGALSDTGGRLKVASGTETEAHLMSRTKTSGTDEGILRLTNTDTVGTDSGRMLVLANNSTAAGNAETVRGTVGLGKSFGGNQYANPYIANTGGDCGIVFAYSGSSTYNSVNPCTVDGSSNSGGANLGNPSVKWNVLYADNSTIVTSDRNDKQDIETLTAAETRVAVAAKSLLRKYRFVKAVTKKGDSARIHVGIIAQDLKAAFEAESLDSSRYGMFCSDTWYEYEGESFPTQEEAPEGAVEVTKLGIRYDELLAFIIAAI
jgi:hypothetical protein